MIWLRRYKAVLILGLLFCLPVAAGVLGFNMQAGIEWIQGQGIKAFLITIPAHVLMSVSPASSDPIALTNGFIYGLTTGAVVNWIGSMLGSVVGYWLVFWGAREVRMDSLMEKLPTFLRKIPISSPYFLIGVRFVPLIGSDFIKYAAPMYRVPFYRFAWTSAVAIVPWAILMAAVGSGAAAFIQQWFY